MDEIFLGGVASRTIGRMALKNDPFNTGPGYALYFTDSRIIGLSYQRMLSRSYYPAYISGLAFVAVLTSEVVYAKLAGIPGDQPGPFAFILVPLWWTLAVSSLILMGLRPWQTGKKIRREAPKSLMKLSKRSIDLAIDRASIAEITVERYRANIHTKSGHWFSFTIRQRGNPLSWHGDPGQLLSLIRKFCSLDPAISFFAKQRRQWKLVTPTTNY